MKGYRWIQIGNNIPEKTEVQNKWGKRKIERQPERK